MSGGFFRGTSADQDTRFSNKQAKLMKSQKFPPELEHLVEMTKVKMDVMKPWIANRVTELIGFEDEVLINFIYGLLDKKVVNGKEVQISLTGFMERNTGKFMKELWSLLLSAQQNASGVPQQFLDAKEEETRKKKAETDRIANEIQRKKEKEKREKEQEMNKKMDGDVDIGRDNDASLEPSKHQSRASSRRSTDEKLPYERSGSRGRSRGSRSPRSADHSPSPRRRRSRSPSKSFSNSRSYSEERLRSRSISKSPQSRVRSISLERKDRSPPRRSISPRRRRSPRRNLSPPRGRPSHSRLRSISPLRYRSPSPARYRKRSPLRRRSRSPMRRRTRSPMRRRSSSPSRSRSQSPVRRRSPYVRRRSRSPIRRRSPVSFRRRSPTPSRRRYQRSPSTPHRRSPSPVRRRSPLSGRRRLVSPIRRRSPSPQDRSSPSAVRRRSPSPVRKVSPKGKRRSPALSPGVRIRSRGKYSPTRYSSPSEDVDRPVNTFKGSNTSERQSLHSLRSPQRDFEDRSGSRREVPALPPSPPSPHRSPSVSESTPAARKRSPSEERSRGSYEVNLNRKKDKMIHPESFSPPPKARQQKPHHDNSDNSAEAVETKYSRDARDRKYRSPRKVSPTSDKRKGSFNKVHREDESSPERLRNNHPSELRSRSDGPQSRKNVELIKSEKPSGRMDLAKNSDQRELPATRKGTSSSKREKESYNGEENRANERSQSLSNDIKGQLPEPESLPKLSRKVEQSDRSGLVDSGSEESDKHRAKVKDKRKHKRSEREEIASDDGSSSDSHVEDRKEAKRRRKDEKRLKKEERRRRREERRRRREERRAEKRRLKSTDASSPPSDFEKNNDGHSSDDEYVRKRDTRGRDIEETESEQKKLEIALREKALESLRAKKGISH